MRVRRERGFTILELLVCMVVVGILIALLVPVAGKAKGKARVATCMSQVRQIGLSIRMYADDSEDRGPTKLTGGPVDGWTAYRKLIASHLTSRDRVFACPSDTY